MGSVIQRWKKLRLCWKLIPLVLLAGLIGFIWWARLPWYEIRMTQVVPYEGHPDWLEVRFEVENLRGREFEIMVEEGSAIANGNLYVDRRPMFIDENWISGFISIDSTGSEQVISTSVISFPKRETMSGRSLIHSELGSLRVRASFNVFPKDSSFHQRTQKYLNDLGYAYHKLPLINQFRSSFLNWGFAALFPEVPVSQPFVPDELKEGDFGLSLVEECKTFSQLAIPPSLGHVADTMAWRFVHEFATSNGENLGGGANADELEELFSIIDSASPSEKAYLNELLALTKRVGQTREERFVRESFRDRS